METTSSHRLHDLFSLTEPSDLPPLSVSPAYHSSSLQFLKSLRRRKSEILKLFLVENGWPDEIRCGENAEAAAFMIAIHADYDLELQITCYQLLLQSIENGTTTRLGFLAFLTDRILCNQGKRQRFGTQIREVSNGCFVPQPMQDVEHIDDLRKNAGLEETLSDYYLRVNGGDMLLYRPLIEEYARELEEIRENKVVSLFPETHAPH
jgi:hypothetical protein